MFTHRSALVEFHQHTGGYDIISNSKSVIIDCIPEAVVVNIQCRSVAPVGPPTNVSVPTLPTVKVVVVFTQTTELHPVADYPLISCCGNCISLVSAESTHAQTILVSLWT